MSNTPKDVADLCRDLVDMTLGGEGYDRTIDELTEYVAHPSVDVRGLVATCVGHIGRLYGDAGRTHDLLKLLRRLSLDPSLEGRIQDAVDDLQMYIRKDISL